MLPMFLYWKLIKGAQNIFDGEQTISIDSHKMINKRLSKTTINWLVVHGIVCIMLL